MLVRELIALLQKVSQDKLVEMDTMSDWQHTDPAQVYEQGDVVVITAREEDESEVRLIAQEYYGIFWRGPMVVQRVDRFVHIVHPEQGVGALSDYELEVTDGPW